MLFTKAGSTCPPSSLFYCILFNGEHCFIQAVFDCCGVVKSASLCGSKQSRPHSSSYQVHQVLLSPFFFLLMLLCSTLLSPHHSVFPAAFHYPHPWTLHDHNANFFNWDKMYLGGPRVYIKCLQSMYGKQWLHSWLPDALLREGDKKRVCFFFSLFALRAASVLLKLIKCML